MAGLDTGASDSALASNDDFVEYGTINILVGFETIRTAALSEEECTVAPTTPLTYNYCPGMVAASLNSLATSVATATTRIAENDELVECLIGYTEAYCSDEVADYISNVVVPEEAATPGYSMALDSVLSSWIALVAQGDAVSLEASLRNSMCFTSANATLDALVDGIHPASATMLVEICQAGESGAAALMRYNTAFSANDDDAYL